MNEMTEGATFADLTVTTLFEPTVVLATRAGEIWQLWHCRYTGKRQWKKLPGLDEAFQTYGYDTP